MPHHHDHTGSASDLEDQKICHMRRALDSSDVELVKLMVMGEGLNLNKALALHYAVENCSREVVKALLELGAADVNYAINYGKRSKLEFMAGGGGGVGGGVGVGGGRGGNGGGM
ncbi:unnamed protein product [Fraxinus pennsylvanica]|uniref:Uncharacterized protein n=1 Tax=Fraxinus pennsylvanica TaxID=56036 RepID=A0AAD1YZ17_9LAMI|nr:unnamed protein product [Fraxinus pennsylvanica]